jgi:hypothetical protein
MNVGNAATTNRGFPPFGTPSCAVLGAVIFAAANATVPEAAIVIGLAPCGVEGFVTVKLNVYDDVVNSAE